MKNKVMAIILFLVPFVLGTIGYYMNGISVIDAFYGSFALYMVNPVLDEKNIFVEVARWLAPVTLANGLVLVVKEWREKIKKRIYSLKPNTIVIYGSANNTSLLKSIIPNSIVADNNEIYKTEEIIVSFSNDNETLSFLDTNSLALKGRKVYAELKEINPQYMDKCEIKFYNTDDIIAREYWKKRNLVNFYKSHKLKLDIAIIGENNAAVQILEKALLNNLYSIKQQFTYHIWDSNRLYENLHKDFDPMNDDKIIYHHGDIKEDINMMPQMDRIIICYNAEHSFLNALFELCTENEIDFLGDSGKYIDFFYDNKNVHFIDADKKYITDENIRTKKQYEDAMDLNYKYASRYGTAAAPEEEWDKLNNFLKYSNVAAADYHDIRLIIMEADNTADVDEQMNELEHIRWCRFHSINHWKYGSDEKGKKDVKKRLHPCLIKYSELSAEDKAKDRETIGLLLDRKRMS
ncbi:MAG: hypothetical protein IKS17_11075 [Firmicutes bacterium]|nr:hypothetical protein [Bacillota bacterium]